MARGTIKRIFEDRGYGFIQPDKRGEKDVWFHASSLKGASFDQLRMGLSVEYEADDSPRGLQANSVRVLTAQPPAQPPAIAGRSDPRRSAAHRAHYRFLNPYNFVRFLQLPKTDGAEQHEPLTATATAFHAAGVKPKMPAQPSAESRLLRRCVPPPHDRYVGLTGKITCKLKAITPLFVSDSEKVEQRGEHRSYEFFKLNGDPALPATSLRGMVRGVFEAVTNSCVVSLSEARLSYHLDAAAATKLVPARIEIGATDKLSLRLLHGATELRWGERPVGPQYAAWVLRYLPPIRRSQNIPNGLPYGRRQVISLNGYQHKSHCWALLKRYEHPRRKFSFWNVERLGKHRADLPGQLSDGELVAEGYLCITNQNIENKHDERFFFFDGGLENAHIIPLNGKEADTIRANYQTLIRDYQQRHQDRVKMAVKMARNPEERDSNRPAFSRFIVHKEEGALRDGDLVYVFLTAERKVKFIVPVSVPRVAYDHSIASLLPDNADNEELAACSDPKRLCPACRVFGWVAKNTDNNTEQVAYAGRVRFSHGEITHNAGKLSPVPLAILSSPKPTTTRFYLKPKEHAIPKVWTSDDAKEGYDGENVLRGRKFYRHHGAAQVQEYRRTSDRCDDQNRTVRDALKPGTQFKFTIRFENLAPIELGALLWSLEMDGTCVHRLGFAKPLGFGSVKIEVDQVELLDAAKRYDSLDDNGWQPLDNWRERLVKEFKREIAVLYGNGKDDFEQLANVQDLRAMLGEQTTGLPVHYPRTAPLPHPEGRNFEWFMGNNRYIGYALGPATKDEGLPLIIRDGTEIP